MDDEDDEDCDIPGESLMMDAFLQAQNQLSQLLDDSNISDADLEAIYLRYKARNEAGNPLALGLWMEEEALSKIVIRSIANKMGLTGAQAWCVAHDCDASLCDHGDRGDTEDPENPESEDNMN